MRQAIECAELHSNAVILLGIAPNQPETEYGWIEPGEPLMASGPRTGFRSTTLLGKTIQAKRHRIDAPGLFLE